MMQIQLLWVNVNPVELKSVLEVLMSRLTEEL